MNNQADRLRSLAEGVLEKINRIANEESTQRHEGARVITVTSGKGGVGKTLVSVNLSIVLAHKGKRVLLFDADLGLSNVNVQIGLVPDRDLGHFARGEVSLEQAIAQGPSGIHVLSGGSGLSELYNAPTTVLLGALAELGRLGSRYDFIIIDTGAGLSQMVQKFVVGVPDILLVTTSEPTAITDAYAMLKFLSENSPAAFISVLCNMCDEQEANRTYNALLTATQSFLKTPPKVSYLGNLPRDNSVRSSIIYQQPVVNAFPESRVSQGIFSLASKLAASAPAAHGNIAAGPILGELVLKRPGT